MTRTGTSLVTNINVDDLERCLAISADVAPAFEEQARQWLEPGSGKTFEPGARERLVALVSRQAQARAVIDRWGVGLKNAGSRLHELT